MELGSFGVPLLNIVYENRYFFLASNLLLDISAKFFVIFPL
jgi:hypothetical protein